MAMYLPLPPSVPGSPMGPTFAGSPQLPKSLQQQQQHHQQHQRGREPAADTQHLLKTESLPASMSPESPDLDVDGAGHRQAWQSLSATGLLVRAAPIAQEASITTNDTPTRSRAVGRLSSPGIATHKPASERLPAAAAAAAVAAAAQGRRALSRAPPPPPPQEEQGEELTLAHLQQLLRIETEARQAAEDEAYMLEQQLLTWQQAAATAQAALQSAQSCRDSAVRENLALQQGLLEAEEERRVTEAQLRRALSKLDEVGQPGVKDTILDQHAGQCEEQEAEGAPKPRDLAPHADKVAALTQENNDLTGRLVEVTLELALLKEEQARTVHHVRMVEEVNQSLVKRVECLSEAVADLRCSKTAKAGASSSSSFLHTSPTL